MCPSPLGRVQTRIAILIGPAILGLILWAATGNEGYLVLIGVYLLMGAALDAGLYPFIIRWQPPWLTFVLAVGEYVILIILGRVLEVGLSDWQATWFYWVSWAVAIATKIVILPFVSLSWIEDAGEFRQTGWTVDAGQVPRAVDLMPIDVAGPPPALAREFSVVRPVPDEIRDIAPPSVIERAPGGVAPDR
ncbi:MAG: hypothetical protein AB7V42_00680 [Thermoleophilia bacterium]